MEVPRKCQESAEKVARKCQQSAKELQRKGRASNEKCGGSAKEVPRNCEGSVYCALIYTKVFLAAHILFSIKHALINE